MTGDDDLDCDALAAGAHELGFDFNDWLSNGPFVALSYEAKTFPTKGPLGQEFDRFHATVRIPEGQRPKIQVVLRTGRRSEKSDQPKGKLFGGSFRR